ncbi:unnamed protein product [Lactuca saligna]|uniref:Myb/SANT-like domain-containing protein n=1 Tax=Lactuca saligna TaxID=75948 RepID=A0AA35YNI9_LACSI|nr:unnamed protein product [Lactuca saligna]
MFICFEVYVRFNWVGGHCLRLKDSEDALKRDDKLLIPRGRCCLVDAGLPHTIELMTPYRGVRYHLKEYSAHPPLNAREFFNLRHASLRNAIERAFGILKRRVFMTKRAADGSVVKKKLTWIDHMDNILVEALVKEDQLGNRVHGTFTLQAYGNMIAGMTKEFNRPITKDQIKNRMKTLKGNFSKWYDMYQGTSLIGFSWNSHTKYIEAEEEVCEQTNPYI